MESILGLLVLAVGFVAITNGANANFKGVASLYGSGTTSRSTALWWGTVTTFAGSIASVFLAAGLLKKFSGRGLVGDELLMSPVFTSAVAGGAAWTSFLANRLGFPVSTTHALVGGLLGAGLAGGRDQVQWGALGTNFLFPLLFSPIIAFVLGATTYRLLRVCECAPDHRNPLLDVAHFASAGAASFSRGLNDTPKMAALLLIAPNVSTRTAMLFVGVLIAVGALIDAKNVAETLGKRVTDMNPGQGFAANIVTATLVATASLHGLPASTTHVSVGSMLGMGASTKQAKWKTSAEILVAWITAVPCSAVFAAACYLVSQWFFL